MTPDQRKIINFIYAKGTATKADIVALDGGQYYCNANKHIGDRLSRMVNSGMLERVKPGVFRIGSGKNPGNDPVNENQTKLF
jgi:predicted transcriptional regulator of viral defense system